MGWLTKWLDLSLGTKCLFMIAIPATVSVSLAAASYLVGTESRATSKQVNASFRIGSEIERLRSSEIETSTQARAYLITADEQFARKTREALAAFDSAWQNLSELTKDDPVQSRHLAEIEKLKQSRVERIFGDADGFRSHTLLWHAIGRSLIAGEVERMGMERSLKAMLDANTRAVDAYLDRAGKLRDRRNGILGLGLLLGVIGTAVMLGLSAQGITSRIRILQANIAHVSTGTRIDSLPGKDEIGSLSAGLVQIARVLGQQRVALESALDGIAEVDGQGHYRWLNKAFAEIAGLTAALPPQTLQATVQAEDRPKIQEAIRVMQLGGRAAVGARLAPLGGPAAEVEMTFLQIQGQLDAGFYVFLREIGPGREAASELIRAKDAAVASNRAKTEFLAKVSHDIRTPLNAILGAADLLSQTSLSSDQSEYVHMFQRNCRRLVALINDFLDFSRIEAGAIHLEEAPFRIRETVDDAVATFADAAARKGILLGVDIDPQAPDWQMGDCLRIQQVLVNLLSNALKFTMEGRVDVRVKVLENSDSAPGLSTQRLSYEVSDTGPGIAPENRDRIFMQFVQLPHQTTGPRGTGLGLTICRDLVELMGGEIGVSSQVGGGSNFHFSLPLVAAAPTDLAPPEADSSAQAAGKLLASSQPIRILIAEDTEDNRLLIEHYLRSELVELQFAFTGQDALDAVRRGEKFDLILMDLDMPVLDGLGAVKAIRAWESSRGGFTPIVALTADAMSEAVHASLDAGCVAHVAKPVERGTLLKTIQRYAAAAHPSPSPATTIPVSEEIRALVPHYLASKPKQIQEARESLTAGDFGSVRRFGHNLKGTGRGYGFPAIEELGREIEKAALEADPGRAAEQLDTLHRFVVESGAAIATPVS